jgi:hypothetical protein
LDLCSRCDVIVRPDVRVRGVDSRKTCVSSITADPPASTGLPPGRALPCVLDIEASGFGRGSYPIEIGVVLPDGTAYCTLIVPADDWTHWDGEAERMHGISRELLLRHGRHVREVAEELNRQLAESVVYCDNWAHDYPWLARLFDAAGLQPRFRLHHLRELLDETAAARFDSARDMVARSLLLRRHRASSDARVLQLSVARALDPTVPAAEGSP